jgi:hypothetical protein
MRKLFLALFVGLLSLTGFAQEPGNVQTADGTSIRASAVLTSSNVLSTTFTVAEARRAKAIHYYIAFTKGSLQNATFIPAGAMDDNPDATGYYGDASTSITVINTGNYHIRVPRSQDGGAVYHGIFSTASGSATSSDAVIKYKLEY